MPYNKYKKYLTGKVEKPKTTVSRHNLLFYKSATNTAIESTSIIIEKDTELSGNSLNQLNDSSNVSCNGEEVSR